MKKERWLIGAVVIFVLALNMLAACTSTTPKPTTPTPAKPAPTTAAAKPAPTTAVPATTTTAAPAKFQFKAAHYWPATHMMNVEFFQYFLNLIGSKSKGQIAIKNYAGGTVANLVNQTETVSRGLADFTFTGASLDPRLTLTALIEGPYPEAPADYFMVVKAWEAAQNLWEPQFIGLNLKPIAGYTAGRYDMYTKKPVKVLEDLKGMKIRGPGGGVTLTIDALGASAVPLSTAEMYTALERGTIDGSLGLTPSWIQGKNYEVAKYLFLCDLMRSVYTIVMNLNSWKSLPKDLQDIIVQAGHEAANHLSEVLTKGDAADFKFLQEKGMTIYTPPADELARWKSAAFKPVDWYLKTEGALGKQIYDVVAKTALELQKTKK